MCGHLVWFTERGNESFSDKWFPGAFEGSYFSLVTASTVGYGDYVPRLWKGKLMTSGIIISGIIFFSWFLAQLTSIPKYEPQIAIKDLTTLTVATVAGTTGHRYLEELGIPSIKTYATAEEAYSSLVLGSSEAIVYDGPSIRYFRKTKAHGKVMFGELLNEESYGFLVKDDEIRKELNIALTTMEKNGKLSKLRAKWFETK
jgi:ABC-type amino acid transport substrate-binding protein